MSEDKSHLIKIPEEKWNNTVANVGWDEERISNLKIMVVGAGALGNEVLKNLALLNVGNIFIVDFDHVEYANLAKSVLYREEDCGEDQLKALVAARKIKEINHQVKVMAFNGDIRSDIGLGVFRRMDAVIGCLDNRLARLMLNRHCFKVGKPWVDGAIENLSGELTVFMPGKACYECNLTDQERKWIHYELGCFKVAMENLRMGRIPTTPISSSIIAAMQVQEGLKLAMGNLDKSLAGRKFNYNGMNNDMMLYELDPLEKGCLSHFQYDPIEEADDLSAEMSLQEVLNWLSDHFKTGDPAIKLESEIILEIFSKNSENYYPVLMPHNKFTAEAVEKYKEGVNDEISVSTRPGKIVKYLDKQFPEQNKPLTELGIPRLDILRVIIDGEARFVELTGDKSFLKFL
jgi:molybdopterin/thiamine biosynthesis adenylyltransferase